MHACTRLGLLQSFVENMPAFNDKTLRQIAQGSLRGSLANNGALVWRGIPYAAPPVGPLRWKAPRRPSRWQGELAALDNGNPCVQDLSLARPFTDDDNDGLVGSEDCLYLNVFAPGGSSSADRLPVMFWIHGGGNVGGHNAASTYDGSFLAQRHGLVVVTINYRLGMLGWFWHPALGKPGASAADRSGNWGTLDIIQGLEWVRDNIAVFGGDPDNVTVFGESAGGQNVFSLLVSPLADRLFHRAIAQSGGLDHASMASACNYADDAEPGGFNSGREVVNRLLVQLGKATSRMEAKSVQDAMCDEEIAELLRALSPRVLFELMNPEKKRLYDAPRLLGDGHVLPAEPWGHTIAAGRFNKVPLITGTNRDERRFYQLADARWVKTLRETPADYVLYAHYGSLAWKQHAVDDVAAAFCHAGYGDVYAYRFDWDEQGTIDSLNVSLALGAGHSVELPFVFGTAESLTVPLGDPDAPGRRALSASMMSYWAEHAYTGSPGSGRDGCEVPWTPWRDAAAEPKFMVLDTAADGGVRMSSERVDHETLKQAVLRERGFASQQLHGRLYRGLFENNGFSEDEYLKLRGEL
jgi:para-nitrobenzyl esterase